MKKKTDAPQLVVERRRSPLGILLLVCDEQARLRALEFEDHAARMHRLLQLHYGQARFTLVQGRAAPALTSALDAFFAGDLRAIERVPVCTGGTPFQRRVWQHLRAIPAGATASYAELAAAIGSPGACRAVGRANAANPAAIVVPCHRVIGRSGALTGYAGGMSRKRWLLEHERAAAS